MARGELVRLRTHPIVSKRLEVQLLMARANKTAAVSRVTTAGRERGTRREVNIREEGQSGRRSKAGEGNRSSYCGVKDGRKGGEQERWIGEERDEN